MSKPGLLEPKTYCVNGTPLGPLPRGLWSPVWPHSPRVMAFVPVQASLLIPLPAFSVSADSCDRSPPRPAGCSISWPGAPHPLSISFPYLLTGSTGTRWQQWFIARRIKSWVGAAWAARLDSLTMEECPLSFWRSLPFTAVKQRQRKDSQWWGQGCRLRRTGVETKELSRVKRENNGDWRFLFVYNLNYL